MSIKYYNWKQKGGLRTENQKDFYGYLASVAYGNTTAGRNDKLKKFKLDEDWVQDTDLSTPDVAILVNKKTKELVSSVTGSRFTDPKHRWRDIRSVDITYSLYRINPVLVVSYHTPLT